MIRPVVGVDPSLTGTGVAIVLGDAAEIVQTTTIRSTGHRGDSLETRRRRLKALRDEIMDWIPDNALVVLEGPAYSQGSAGTWDRAGLWWSILHALGDREVLTHVALCPPSTRAMYATGRGNAGKMDVVAAIVRRFPQVETANDNEADALAMAAMGRRLLGHPIDNPPQTHLRAMSGLEYDEEAIHVLA